MIRKLVFTSAVILFSLALGGSSFAQQHCKTYNVTSYGGNDGAIKMNLSGGTPPYQYNWSNGSQEQDLNNLTSGVYICSVTDNAGCTYSFTFNITEPSLGGVIHPQSGESNLAPGETSAARFISTVQVYPNPTEGALHVNFSSTPNTAVSLKVMDINGRVVIENNVGNTSGQYSNQLDLSRQPKGIYFVQVKTDQEIVNQKIIIQ